MSENLWFSDVFRVYGNGTLGPKQFNIKSLIKDSFKNRCIE